jgi:acyl-CoA thioester hydrolase
MSSDTNPSRKPLLPRSAYRHWHRIETLWADNDVYGHVNNTVHYRWFDTVVNSWLIEAGLLDIENGNPIGLVVETGCRYAASISFPEAVEVGLVIERLGSSSVTYRLGIFPEGSSEVAAEGHFTHVYVDRDSRRPVPLPEAWRATLNGLLIEGQ